MIPIGTPSNEVFCDFCDTDFTNRDDKGGLLFQSKAICPICAPKTEADAKKYNEERFIRGRCPPDMEFRSWVIVVLRNLQPGTVSILELKDE